MSLGYFLQDFAVLVHTRELGGTYQLLFHHSSAVFAYLLGMVSSYFVIFKGRILSEYLKKLFSTTMFWAGIVLIDSWPNFQHHLLTSGKLTTILRRWDMCRRLLNMDSHFFSDGCYMRSGWKILVVTKSMERLWHYHFSFVEFSQCHSIGISF